MLDCSWMVNHTFSFILNQLLQCLCSSKNNTIPNETYLAEAKYMCLLRLNKHGHKVKYSDFFCGTQHLLTKYENKNTWRCIVYKVKKNKL